MIRQIGELVDREKTARQIVSEIEKGFASPALLPLNPSRSCVYLIWRGPWMAAGRDTFITDMLRRCGFENLATRKEGRYPSLTAEELESLNPEVVLLSSEPYPFAERHLAEMQALLPTARVMLADGELFSWYGSRLLNSPAYFSTLTVHFNN
jgi:ABC-type Fe3+-hydroxamate transport system substrate-binding protein